MAYKMALRGHLSSRSAFTAVDGQFIDIHKGLYLNYLSCKYILMTQFFES